MLTPGGLTVALSLIIVMLLGWFTADPIFTVVFMALAGAFLAEALIFTSTIKGLRSLEGRRSLSEPVITVGDPLEVKLELRSHWGRSLGHVEFKDRVPDGFELIDGSSTLAQPLRAAGLLSLKYRLRATQKGEYRFGEADITLYDLLALFWNTWSVTSEARVKVYPRLPQGAGLLAARRPDPQLSFGETTTRRRGMGSEFYAIRSYVPGDDYRFMAWKALAKNPVHSPMVRDHEGEKDVAITLAMFNGPSTSEGGLGMRLVDRMAQGLLALAELSMLHKTKLSMLYAEGQGYVLMPSGRGYNRMYRSLEAALRMEPVDSMETNEMTEALAGELRRGSLGIVIFDACYPNELDPRPLIVHKKRVAVVLVARDALEVQGSLGTGSKANALRLLLDRERRHLQKQVAVCSRYGIRVGVCLPKDLTAMVLRTYSEFSG